MSEDRADQARGHLKIFFGYAAGVGKTYAMLKAARALKRRGVDVVAGYVEPHSRPATAALMDGLEQIPMMTVLYKGVEIQEFDLDGALMRRPKLVLIDELAHTNGPECRHHKRYQDVEELLKAGIDVYTTVNVHHIESINDMVASITGITVQERIPDQMFDNADQVELVDMEPEELMERLKAGKIYRKTQAQFFDEKNLAALREIALRRCADRINKMVERSRQPQDSDYYTEEHILVCLSSSPTNPKIIRTAARMATAFKGNFTALFVETPDFSRMDEEDRARLRENSRLARQLGATVETVYGDDVATQIAEFARLSGVSKVVIGRMNARRRGFFGRPSLTDRLIAAAPNLDVHIIPDRESGAYRARKEWELSGRLSVLDVLKSVFILAAATGIGLFFNYLGFSEANIIMIYIMGVLLTAVLIPHRLYSLAISVISVLLFNFFFTDPRYTFNAYGKEYPVTFLIMFLAALLTSSLTVRLKKHARQAAETAYRTKILLETNQLLQKGMGKPEIVSVTAGQLIKLLRKNVVFYLKAEEGVSDPVIFTAEGEIAPEELTSENERAVAAWVYKNNKHAGATTGTFGNAKCLYLAVRVNESVYGVVGIAVNGEQLDAFENSIMLSLLGECALALENETALREREQAAILAKNEQLRANLLRSISHDLRTPLTAISGNAGILMANGNDIDPDRRSLIYHDIYEDALWLINLVENLLSVTRIEDGTMSLNKNAELMEEVIEEALHHVKRKDGGHHIKVVSPEEFLLAKMDARLIVQVVINIVGNAIKYTPPESVITISTGKADGQVVVEIADTGNGISDEAKEKIFDMFYTEHNKAADSRRGLGMGLALCKSIIGAHGGVISVTDNHPHGTIFRFTLPAEEVALHE